MRARPGVLEIGIGVAGIALFVEYTASKMRNLRLETPAANSSLSWRNTHMAFDYDGIAVNFGSAISDRRFANLAGRIQMATGTTIPEAEAFAEDTARQDRKELHEQLDDIPEQQAVAEPVQPKPVRFLSFSTLMLIAADFSSNCPRRLRFFASNSQTSGAGSLWLPS